MWENADQVRVPGRLNGTDLRADQAQWDSILRKQTLATQRLSMAEANAMDEASEGTPMKADTATGQRLPLAGSGEGPIGTPQSAWEAGTVERDRSKVSPVIRMSHVFSSANVPACRYTGLLHTSKSIPQRRSPNWENPPARRGTKGHPEGHTHVDRRPTNSQTRECPPRD